MNYDCWEFRLRPEEDQLSCGPDRMAMRYGCTVPEDFMLGGIVSFCRQMQSEAGSSVNSR